MEVLCSMWNGTPMQLCSLYLCFMKKHHTFVSERPGHGEFGKKSKRNKVLKSELGGLIGINESWFRSRGDISGVNDLTEIKNSGIYKLNDVTFNLSYKYGSLIVLNSGIQVIQFSLAFHSNVLHIRTNWNNEKWTNWQTVSLT